LCGAAKRAVESDARNHEKEKALCYARIIYENKICAAFVLVLPFSITSLWFSPEARFSQ
jgi:hypothetical protein